MNSQTQNVIRFLRETSNARLVQVARHLAQRRGTVYAALRNRELAERLALARTVGKYGRRFSLSQLDRVEWELVLAEVRNA